MRSFDNMIVFRVLFVAASCGGLASCAPIPATNGSASPREQVFATERGFAATMAHRDLAAFGGFIDDEAVFLGGAEPLRGKGRIVESWARYFNGEEAPFSWEPDQVEVLASGMLAFSSGLVRGPDGQPVARFNSIWRQQSSGAWKIVFDKGSPLPARPRES